MEHLFEYKSDIQEMDGCDDNCSAHCTVLCSYGCSGFDGLPPWKYQEKIN